MMPPSHRPSAPPIQAGPPVPAPANPALDGVGDALPPHADYNLHPLAVSSLEHYVLPVEEKGERFQVR